jgi:Cyclic nucleotide-binding domain
VTGHEHGAGNHFGNVAGVDSVSVVSGVGCFGRTANCRRTSHRFENTASDLIDCADHINDEIITRQQLVARLRLIKFLQAGPCHGGLHMDRKPRVVEDDQEGLAPAGTKEALVEKPDKDMFDPKDFLAKVGAGKRVLEFHKNQHVFEQGDVADTVFYIQKGKVKLTVLSEQGKEAWSRF